MGWRLERGQTIVAAVQSIESVMPGCCTWLMFWGCPHLVGLLQLLNTFTEISRRYPHCDKERHGDRGENTNNL